MKSNMAGKIESFEIELNRENAEYYPGELVEGQISLLVVEYPIQINSLRLNAIGKTKVKWFSSSSLSSVNRIQVCSNEEVHFDYEFIFLDKQAVTTTAITTTTTTIYLDLCRHVFSFRFKLPCDLPPYYISQFGGTWYSCMAELELPWTFSKRTFKKLRIRNFVDLNEHPILFLPTEIERFIVTGRSSSSKSTNTSRSNNKKRQAKIAVSTNRGGYAPGELISYSLRIQNYSDRSLRLNSVAFGQLVKLFATATTTTQPQKLSQEIFYELVKPPRFDRLVEKQSTLILENLTLHVPNNCIASLNQSKMLEIYYTMRVTIDSKFEIDVPITIFSVQEVKSNNKSD